MISVEDYLRTFHIVARLRCNETLTTITQKGNAIMLHMLDPEDGLFESVYSIEKAQLLVSGLVTALILANKHKHESDEVPADLTVDTLTDFIFRQAKVSEIKREEMN
jgi:hypothetical protein